MRYGLPRLGSKNAIATWVVSELPSAETFVDVCGGGGSVTHAAILSGKYKKFILNDLDARLPRLFLDCAQGKYTVDTHNEWISKAEFDEKKKTDAFIALVWSFGNNGKDYLYAADKSDFKQAYHRAIYFNEVDGMEPYGIKLTLSSKPGVYDRYLEYQKQIRSQIKDKHIQLQHLINFRGLEELERLQGLERIKGVQDLHSLKLPEIKIYGTDYADVPIPETDRVIYVDPPYYGRRCDGYDGFDHKRFWEWADKQDNIFISEYSMPDNFVKYAWQKKKILSCNDNSGGYAKEIIWTNQRTYDKLSEDRQEMAKWNFAEQMTIFDLMGGAI